MMLDHSLSTSRAEESPKRCTAHGIGIGIFCQLVLAYDLDLVVLDDQIAGMSWSRIVSLGLVNLKLKLVHEIPKRLNAQRTHRIQQPSCN